MRKPKISQFINIFGFMRKNDLYFPVAVDTLRWNSYINLHFVSILNQHYRQSGQRQLTFTENLRHTLFFFLYRSRFLRYLPDFLLLIQTLISDCIANWWHLDKSKDKCILLQRGDDKQIMVLVVTHTHRNLRSWHRSRILNAVSSKSERWSRRGTCGILLQVICSRTDMWCSLEVTDISVKHNIYQEHRHQSWKVTTSHVKSVR